MSISALIHKTSVDFRQLMYVILLIMNKLQMSFLITPVESFEQQSNVYMTVVVIPKPDEKR
jgi:hypothetical protein